MVVKKTKTKKKTTKKTTSTKRKKTLPFVKMHGTGNDMIILDCIKKNVATNPGPLARKLCNRKTGIGADQLLVLSKSRKADYSMRVFNVDGTEAEACGNGIRCIIHYLHNAKYTTKKELNIETLAGIRATKFSGRNVQVDMGEPIMKGKEIPVNLSGRVVNRPLKLETKEFRITCLSLGNPHCVIFHEDLDSIQIDRFGPQIETNSIFPKKANVSFVNVLGKNEIEMRVWERGAGETLSCGSAASAVAVASVLNGFTERKVNIAMPGGKVDVEWSQKDNRIYLKGPAELVCKGEIYI